METLQTLAKGLSIYVENLMMALSLKDLDKINWLADEADRQIADGKKLRFEVYGEQEPSTDHTFGSWIKAIATEDLDKIKEIAASIKLTEAHKKCAKFSPNVLARIDGCSLADAARAYK